MQYPYLNSGESTIFAGLRRADHEVEGQGELGLLPLCSLPLPLSPTNIGSSTPPVAIYTKSIRQMQAETKHIQTYTLPHEAASSRCLNCACVRPSNYKIMTHSPVQSSPVQSTSVQRLVTPLVDCMQDKFCSWLGALCFETNQCADPHLRAYTGKMLIFVASFFPRCHARHGKTMHCACT